jgi:hypothetical protein
LEAKCDESNMTCGFTMLSNGSVGAKLGVLQKGDVVIVNGKDVYQQDEHQILTLNSE